MNWVSETNWRICVEGYQIYGIIRAMSYHDIKLYPRGAKVTELSFSELDFHRILVPQQLCHGCIGHSLVFTGSICRVC